MFQLYRDIIKPLLKNRSISNFICTVGIPGVYNMKYYCAQCLGYVKMRLNWSSILQLMYLAKILCDYSGPPAWGLGEVLTTPLRKKHMLRITHKLRCFLWRQNNPEVNYSPTRSSGGECF